MTSSQESNTANSVKVQMAKYEAVPTIEMYNRKGWIEYGADNKYPTYLIDLFDSAPVHGALTTSIVEMIAGKGLEGDQTLIDQLDLNSILSDTAFDLKVQGGFFWEIIWSVDRTQIVKIEPLEFENTRLAFVEGEEGEIIITGVYYSKDWSNIRKKCNIPVFIPKLDELKKQEEGRQSFWHFGKTTKSRYYPKPDYDKSLTWINTEKQIGIFHMNNLLNGLMPQFMIHFNNGIPEPEQAIRIKRELEKQLGAENAGGFMLTFNESGKDSPKIDTFPISDADKQYQFLTDEATRKVMIGHRVTTPLLFGIRDGGGLGSNTDEMKVGFQIFDEQVIQPFQRDITTALSSVFLSAGIDTSFTIIPNSPIEMDNENALNAASTALNGAQIESLVNVILQVAAGVLPVQSGKAIVKAGFPSLKKKQIEDIFEAIIPGALDPAEVVQRAMLGKKKEVMQDSYPPTDEMAREAELGLKWREEYGRGGTEVGVARARDISNKRNLSFDTVQRMNSYFSRHEVDKQATGWNNGEEGFPTAGRVAWQLWGGDPGQAWAARIVERVKREEQTVPENLDQLADELIALGQQQDPDWIEIDSYDVDYTEEDQIKFQLASTGSARPNAESSQDKRINGVLYITRYRYKGEIRDNTREFCRKMLRADKLYRKEDIMQMGKQAVNPGWGPRGAQTYSIWLYKGGGNCHHAWQKVVYVSAKDMKIDVNSPKAKKIAVERAADKGYKTRNQPKVAQRPIDMPYNGFLPPEN